MEAFILACIILLERIERGFRETVPAMLLSTLQLVIRPARERSAGYSMFPEELTIPMFLKREICLLGSSGL